MLSSVVGIDFVGWLVRIIWAGRQDCLDVDFTDRLVRIVRKGGE